MDASSSSSPLPRFPNEAHNPQDEAAAAGDFTESISTPKTHKNPAFSGVKTVKFRKRSSLNVTQLPSSSTSLGSSRRGLRVAHNTRPKPRVSLRRSGGGIEAIGLPLGMSFAAVMAQVLYKRNATDERMSPDHLSSICTAAVRESLANVFEDKLDGLTKNFEQSFGSTLKTLRLIYESSINKRDVEYNDVNVDIRIPKLTTNKGDSTWDSDVEDEQSETRSHTSTQDQSTCAGEVRENLGVVSVCDELAPNGQRDQVASYSSFSTRSVANNSVLSTFEKSVMEQARCNDLKTLELGLTMKRLKLKETQLALNYDMNHLERSKLAMGISKASFKAEKFKNQLEDKRYADLHKMCIDCLVAGMVIMSFSLFYGAYVFSYERITQATTSCSAKGKNSWWIPNPKAQISSWYYTIKCEVLAVSRMSFGAFMILAIAFLLFQRATISQQTMPVTFILLLLGFGCGIAGKLCVDTLGGSGSIWLLFWEIFCLLHFLSIIWTSALYLILYGPLTGVRKTKGSTLFPCWTRQLLYYTIMPLFLPLFCGIMPFASLSEWKNHFLPKVKALMVVGADA